MNLLLTASTALHLTFGVPVACNAPPNTIVASILVAGGTGKSKSFILAGDTADFKISGSNIVVGPSGIAPQHCNTTQSATVNVLQR